AHRPAGILGGLPYVVVHLLVLGVRAVAEVQPRHVHARLDEGTDAFRGSGRRAEGTDDLRTPGHAREASTVVAGVAARGGRSPARARGDCCAARRRRGGGTGRLPCGSRPSSGGEWSRRVRRGPTLMEIGGIISALVIGVIIGGLGRLV